MTASANIAATQYQVELPEFEGPLDLLLSLVDKEKLDITEISLAQVANQYRAYLEKLERLSLEIESSYVVVFAQLLEIKSRVLLPPVEEEEFDGYDPGGFSMDYDGGDPQDDLVEQLKAYKLIKEAADWLGERETAGLARYPHPVSVTEPEWLELEVSVEALAAAWIRLDTSLKAPRQAIELRKVEVSVPERAQQIFSWLQGKSRGFFSQLFPQTPTRPYVVVSFLGLLELVRRNRVRASQSDWNADLELELLSNEPFDLAKSELN